ncbi:unnamed protein product [Phaedon cochleariae]|uniref:Lipase n=1 Tax=Phaedon cochleariae TaxID=80249 RepID=A0A9P0DPM2_PHACE|nr:unnamed protein product [Phaedon cochleariae]
MVAYSWLFVPLIFSFSTILLIGGIENSEIYIELVESRGYPIETHEVETEDGYLLNVYRIPYGKNSVGNGTPNRYPVLMQHGLFGCGENFIWLNQSIGYMLADHGYDVWVMNVRGSWHSVKHKTLDPDKDDAYWRFTWHEMGIYDIPATIDYILKNTGAQNISFIGHSQGTTTIFVMGAVRPEYNEKINGLVAMGPMSVILNPEEIFIRLVAPHYKLFKAIGKVLDIQKFPPFLSNRQMHAMNRFLCGLKFSPRWLCTFLVSILVGPNDDQFDPRIFPITAPLTPSSSSFHQLIHYGQNMMDKKFTTFDWGNAKENLRRYGSEKPVEYNVTNISFKVALYVAPNDVFVSNQTVQFLEDTLPNISEVYRVPYETWTHVDFLWGRDLNIYVHHNLLRTLNGFIRQ